MIWAGLLLVVALAAPAVWAWYMSGRQLAARTVAENWRVARLALRVSAGVGALILALGVAGFVLNGYDWMVLTVVWAVGLFHLCLITWLWRTARRSTGGKRAVR